MDTSEDSTAESSVKAESGTRLMVPREAAWKHFRSHPNFEFSDLMLLAEVSTGHMVVIPPALGSISPEQVTTPTVTFNGSPHLQTLPRDILNTQDGTVAGRHQGVGIRAFPAENVQAALHLLDVKNSTSSS